MASLQLLLKMLNIKLCNSELAVKDIMCQVFFAVVLNQFVFGNTLLELDAKF